jgi:hypothetical protein
MTILDWLVWGGLWLLFGGYLFMFIWLVVKMVRETEED